LEHGLPHVRRNLMEGRTGCGRKGVWPMELSLPPSPVQLAGLRQATRACLRGVASEAADDVVLALNEAATNAILYGSSGGQRVQVVVHVNDDVIQASVLDHGPDLPAQPPTDADMDALGGRGLWLLRRLVDEVRLERVRLGTRVTLRREMRPRAG
jgi:anti-sigma regulatory factor (Ser/Thr protein kinase)